jgi:hypothetical protein
MFAAGMLPVHLKRLAWPAQVHAWDGRGFEGGLVDEAEVAEHVRHLLMARLEGYDRMELPQPLACLDADVGRAGGGGGGRRAAVEGRLGARARSKRSEETFRMP